MGREKGLTAQNAQGRRGRWELKDESTPLPCSLSAFEAERGDESTPHPRITNRHFNRMREARRFRRDGKLCRWRGRWFCLGAGVEATCSGRWPMRATANCSDTCRTLDKTPEGSRCQWFQIPSRNHRDSGFWPGSQFHDGCWDGPDRQKRKVPSLPRLFGKRCWALVL
jgi:hypothetical protein